MANPKYITYTLCGNGWETSKNGKELVNDGIG